MAEEMKDKAIPEEEAQAAEKETADEAVEEAGTEPAGEEEAKAGAEPEETAEEAKAEMSPEEREAAARAEQLAKKGNAAYEEKIADLSDKLMRQMAEFDNFRKRTEKEKSQMFEIGAKSVIEKLLPVVDNFERGLAAVPEEEKSGAFYMGFEKIYQQMVEMLKGIGVTPIEAVGKEFDPVFHNAVMHAEDENAGDNIVAEEFQKGYLYHDAVVRPSMVKVVN